MRQLIDLKCPDCGKQTERYISENQVPCICGKTMYKVIGMPRVALDGTDPGFPGAYDKWATVRENNAAEKRKKSYYQP